MKIKIGARLKELRKKQNVTQEQLAEALGVTNQAVSRWESESGYPDIEYIVPIAKFFSVTANYLLENESVSVLNVEKEPEASKWVCSFCGRHREQVGHLVAGPEKICICGECVLRCVEILMKAQ